MTPALDEVQSTVEWLTRIFPEAAGGSSLDATVREQLLAARRYGLELHTELRAYVAVAWLMGAEFDREFSEAQTILENPLMPAGLKASWLVQWCARAFAAIIEN